MPTTKGNATYMDRLLRAGEKAGVSPNVAAMSEDAVDKAILEWANQFQWELTYHVKDSRVDKLHRGAGVVSGFPDRFYANRRTNRLIVLELKDMLRPVQPLQAIWLSAFSSAGIETAVVRPSDLDEMFAALKGDLILRPPAKCAWRG